ncbi:hypothetical protein QE250_16820, partial [Chromatiaceae bacterium AAb-1]|nr:hypothetical protein [Chromatiaceae bacterium AAb-1]
MGTLDIMSQISIKKLRLFFAILLSIFITSCGVIPALYDEKKAYDNIRTDGYYTDSYGTKYYFYDNRGGYLRIINYKNPEKFFPIAGYSIVVSSYGKKERKMLIMQNGIGGSSYARWIN